MKSEYIEQRNGGYYLAGTRISLDSIICAFKEDLSPEAIQEDFPLLKLSQVYGAIAFYLDHQPEIDQYLKDSESEFESQSIPLAEENPALWERLQRARAAMGEAQVSTIRAKVLKIGAQIRVTVRKVWVSMASSYPWQNLYRQIRMNLRC